MEKTALYARVSTDLQAEKGFSIETQLDKLKAYCAMNDITNFEMYVDAGYSASNLDRPEMKRLMQDIKLGLVDTVIVCKLDRLSRRTKDTLYLVEDVFIKHDVKFVSLTESIDTSTSSGKFFLSILSSVAQLERENIKERTMSGMKKKSELGIKSHTPRVLVGYDYDEKTKEFTINEYEAMQVRLAFDMFLKGEGVLAIFRHLRDNYTTKHGKWKTQKSIQLLLDNQTYLGKFRFQGNYLEGNNIPAIIDEESFNKVKKIRDYNKQNYHRHHSEYLLTGIIFCGECGARLRGYPKFDKSAIYYVCYSRDKSRPHMAKSNTCKLPYFRYDEFNSAVESLLKMLTSEKYFSSVKSPTVDNSVEIDALEKEIRKLSDKSNKIIDLLLDSEIDKETFLKRLNDINAQKEKLQKQLSKFKEKQKPQTDVDFTKAKELSASYFKSDTPEKRRILKQLIHRIVLNKDKTFNIEWLF